MSTGKPPIASKTKSRNKKVEGGEAGRLSRVRSLDNFCTRTTENNSNFDTNGNNISYFSTSGSRKKLMTPRRLYGGGTRSKPSTSPKIFTSNSDLEISNITKFTLNFKSKVSGRRVKIENPKNVKAIVPFNRDPKRPL